ncbi:MAG: hypothetical protein JW928_01930, partial [Candidatus Aureabacteria bacterium]|nr:hypothetical protein [Candidatus Auribacterota bacterium]
TNYDFITWHKSRITIDDANQGELYVINENSQITTQTFTNVVSSERIMLGQRYDQSLTNQNYDEDWDWIFARQYTANPPGTTLEEEESAIKKLVFSTPGQTLVQNQSSTLITVETRDVDGNRVAVTTDHQIRLDSSSSGGRFAPSSASENWSSGNSITLTIPAGQYSVSFYYKDSQVGRPVLTASEYPSMGWTDAMLQFVIISSVSHFAIEVTTPQTAGVPFDITITAKDADGNKATTYTGTALLTANYVTPATGTFLLTPSSVSGFEEGVATVTCQYNDCGTITITAVDQQDKSKTGTSIDIFFVPFVFTIQAENQQTVNAPFTLNITALNAESAVTPNYAGPAGISFTNISPASVQGSLITPDTVTEFSDGIASMTNMTYNRWGEIKLAVFDKTDPSKTGETENILFLPQDFLITVNDAPPSRLFFYISEQFQIVVTARDFNGSVISNYQGTIDFEDVDYVNVPSPYTFVSQDEGQHVFLLFCSEEQEFLLQVHDTNHPDISGISNTIPCKYGKIIIHSADGPVGTIEIPISIVDSAGDIITSDSSTQFKVTLTEGIANNTASATGTAAYITINQGKSMISVTDTEAEIVTITPESLPELATQDGEATFGTIGARGVRILFWREKD